MKGPNPIPLPLLVTAQGLALLFAAAGCQTSSDDQGWRQRTLNDGLYFVADEAPREESLPPPGQGMLVVRHRRTYDAPVTPPCPTFFLIRTAPYVPLALAAPPAEVKLGTGRTALHMTLTAEAGERLETLTRAWQGGRAAVIINGELVTVHKIKAPIEGGRLQVTCCTVGALEHLQNQLRDNLAEGRQ